MVARWLWRPTLLWWLLWLVPSIVWSLNGDTTTLHTHHGWKTFEVITQGDDNGNGYIVPGELDGVGAYMVNDHTLRILVNHETGRACDTETMAIVSEIDVDVLHLTMAVQHMIVHDTLGTTTPDFVQRFRPAWDVVLDPNRNPILGQPQPRFRLFCSSQSYGPNPFGVPGEGFADQIYLFGEEKRNQPFGRLFCIDHSNRTSYQLSDGVGDASNIQGGNGGMMWDSFENVAIVRTHETKHVAFLMSHDGGSETLKLYIGQKNKNKDGTFNNVGFLERNGLAYGSWFYLKSGLPLQQGQSEPGTFAKDSNGAITSSKFEDVDTNPNNPTQVVLGEEKLGVYVFTFDLQFNANGVFDADQSSFDVTMLFNDERGPMRRADNVLWTAADLIYASTDGTDGAVWQMQSDGTGLKRVASSKRADDADGSPSGMVDISGYLGYQHASILLVTTMGCGSSLSVLISDTATKLAPVATPSSSPTSLKPTLLPTLKPTLLPTLNPTLSPTLSPTEIPSTPSPIELEPSDAPAVDPPVNGPSHAPAVDTPVNEPSQRPQTLEPGSTLATIPPTESPMGLFQTVSDDAVLDAPTNHPSLATPKPSIVATLNSKRTPDFLFPIVLGVFALFLLRAVWPVWRILVLLISGIKGLLVEPLSPPKEKPSPPQDDAETEVSRRNEEFVEGTLEL